MKYPDMRLWQLIENIGINWNSEDLTDNVTLISQFSWTSPLLWWTYWKNWRAKLQYKSIYELDTSHIENILLTQTLKPNIIDIFKKELKKRTCIK